MSKRTLSLQEMEELFKRMIALGNWRIVWTSVGFIIFAGPLIWLCTMMTSGQPSEQLQGRILNFIVLIVGSMTGWLLGILISPYGKDEKTQFSDYTKVASAFVSGYLLSKVDPIVEAILDKNLVLQPVAGFRFGVFISSLILFLIFTFATRQYGREMRALRTQQEDARQERARRAGIESKES